MPEKRSSGASGAEKCERNARAKRRRMREAADGLTGGQDNKLLALICHVSVSGIRSDVLVEKRREGEPSCETVERFANRSANAHVYNFFFVLFSISQWPDFFEASELALRETSIEFSLSLSSHEIISLNQHFFPTSHTHSRERRWCVSIIIDHCMKVIGRRC